MKNRNKYLNLLVVGTALSTMVFFTAAQAEAYQIGASVYLQTGITGIESGGWGSTSASNSISTSYGQASASAGFNDSSPAVSATSIGTAGYARAIAGIDDWLTFSGAGGSYADVIIHIGGNWSLSDNPSQSGIPWVKFDLYWNKGSELTNAYSGRRSVLSIYNGGIGTWVENSGSDSNAAAGTFSYDLLTRVYYGADYHLGLAVSAEASAGQSAYIDDPIIIDLPDGVTLTSLSSSDYSGAASQVPVPAPLLLLGSGLAGLAGFRKRFKK